MAIKKSDAVKFVYVNGNSLPSKVDDATIYIIGGTQELYVGNLKIAASIDVDSALSTTSTNPVENQAITKELNKKATIESPTFTGIPNASTAAAGTSTTQIATTAFVQNAVTAATIIVDDALNASSTNPVQNKVIKAALDAKAALASPTFKGTPKAPTAAAGTNTTQIATTAFVQTAISDKADISDVPTATSTLPKMNGTANVGSETTYAKGDHVHPSDTTKANLASPTFTGTPKAPTAAKGTSTTQLATTAFVQTAVADYSKDTISAPIAYGTCDTDADVNEKIITLSSDNPDWKLEVGSLIAIRFTAKNTATSPTFNVNNTGAKPVGYRASDSSDGWAAGEADVTSLYVYNGTSYMWLSHSVDNNTTYTNAALGQGYGTCTTAFGETALTVTLGSYALTVNGIVSVKFTNAVPANATMNINNKGAKNIYWQGRAIVSDVILAGDTATFIYNGQYHLISIDRWGQIVTTTESGLMSPSDKSKLDGIASGANNYTHPSYTARTGKPTGNQTPAFGGTATVSQITSDATGHVTGATDRTIKIPDTVATTSASGLMSKDDKSKLDSIAAGANKTTVDSAMSTTSTNPVQNKVVKQAIDDAIAASDAMIFKGTLGTGGTITALPTTYKTGWTYRVITAGTYAGNVCEVGDLIVALVDRSGSGNVNADWTVAQTNINGALTNVTGTSPITVSGSGSSRAIAHADSGVTAASKGDTSNQTPAFGGTFKVPSATVDAKGHLTALADHTVKIPNTEATTSASGLMSKSDKTKLDGVDAGANAYTHPSYTARTGKPTANQTPAFGGTATVSQITSDATGHVTGATDRTIKIPDTVATTSTSGLMSSDDKTKLDGVETGAQANTITGVKGNAETSYRTGNVNITPANVGALPLTGGTISNGDTAAYINNIHTGVNLEEEDNGLSNNVFPSNSRGYGTLNGSNTLVSAFEHYYFSSGETGIGLVVRNYNIETSALTGYTHFRLFANKSGKVKYSMTNATALKKALGISYGTCDTAAGTAAKVITLIDANAYGFTLSVGAIIGVKFTATNTANNPTLNIDGTGAKKIWYNDALITTSNQKFAGQKDVVTFFMYNGTQWVWMGHSLNDADGYLPLTGGTVSGATTVQDELTLYKEGATTDDLPARLRFSVKDTTTGKAYTSATISAYQDHSASTYGTNMVMQSGGSMILGSGESPTSQYNALKGDTGAYGGKDTWIVADTTINLQAGANNIANRKGVRITAAGEIIPIVADVPTDNVQGIGTADYKWKDVYATTIHGDLDGNATTATSSTKLGTARTIDGVDFDGSAAIVHYGTCATAAGTAAKVVACTSFTLVTGSTIRVKFTVTNTANSPTLNVNSTGAKNIFYKGAAITAGYLIKDHVYEFVYDGTQYCLVGEIYSAATTSIGSASAGTAIAADDITAWSAGTLPTLGTAIPADDITAWSAGTAASASVSGGVLTITDGTAPSLSYSAKSIPNVTGVGTLPSLSYTARSIPNISVTNKTVVTGI